MFIGKLREVSTEHDKEYVQAHLLRLAHKLWTAYPYIVLRQDLAQAVSHLHRAVAENLDVEAINEAIRRINSVLPAQSPRKFRNTLILIEDVMSQLSFRGNEVVDLYVK